MNIYVNVLLSVCGGIFGAALLLTIVFCFFIAKDILQARHWGRKYPALSSPPNWKSSEEIKEGWPATTEPTPIGNGKKTVPLEELWDSDLWSDSLRTKHTLHRINLKKMGIGTSPQLPAVRIVKAPHTEEIDISSISSLR